MTQKYNPLTAALLFPDAKSVGDFQYEAKCPAHDDRSASLSIGQGDDGRTLIHCHAGCRTEDVLAAVGLKMSDLMPPREEQPRQRNKGKIVAEYDYRDASGRLLYQALRFDPKDFRQRCPKEGGGWEWKLNGVERVLYRLPQLLKADLSGLVFVVEGEKDADNLANAGLVATTNVGGASKGKTKWLPQYTESLRGRHVVIIPDNDEPGRSHAASIAKALFGVAASVRILELPDLPAKGDVSDWLKNGGTAEQLNALALTAPLFEPQAGQEKSKTTADPDEATNAFIAFDDDDKKEVVPLEMAEVLRRIRAKTGDWPRRVDATLFIDDSHGVNWLESAASFFGWLQSKVGTVHWHRTLGCVGREEVYSELRRTSQRYRAVENMPHEPAIEGHYYACQQPASGNGETLRALLDRFEPATPIDRDLIQSALMTLFWGGHGGTRPCFLFTSDHGRGVGKSKNAEMLASVGGGIVSFSNNDPIGEVKARLLSPEALTKRVALLDNVKTLKFSWGELEALITAPVISGKRMYVGEANRPNTVTWFITLNGASLSTDMAQRCVIIKVKRPTRSGNWEEDTLRFILENRQQLIADLIGCLRAEAVPLKKFTRWATWEKAVLSRLPEPSEAQAVIASRQGAVDVEADEAEQIEEFFAGQLRTLQYDSDAHRVFIPSQFAARWLNWATNENRGVISAGRVLGQFVTEGRFHRLQQNKVNEWGRGWVWHGTKAEVNQGVYTDLERRITDRTAEKRREEQAYRQDG